MPLIVAPKFGPTVVTKTTIAAPATIRTGRSDADVARRGIGGATGRSRRETSRMAIVTKKAGARPQAETGSITAQVTTNAPYAAAPATGQLTRRQTRAQTRQKTPQPPAPPSEAAADVAANDVFCSSARKGRIGPPVAGTAPRMPPTAGP